MQQLRINKLNTELLGNFLKSRRQGTSPRTIDFYRDLLTPFLRSYEITPEGISIFLGNLKCGNARHAYYRAIRAFCNWAWKMELIKTNPILKIDAPKVSKKILPSLNVEQVAYLIEQADNLRDKALISLFADSGLRLSELGSIKTRDIDWGSHTVVIWGKGKKQRRAPFTERSARLLKELIDRNGTENNIWGLTVWGIVSVLRRLEKKTALPCNPHTFRRTFASNLHRAGLDINHIRRLGGWESITMVMRYTSSVGFDESMKLYKAVMK